jgi:hypothetical protein
MKVVYGEITCTSEEKPFFVYDPKPLTPHPIIVHTVMIDVTPCQSGDTYFFFPYFRLKPNGEWRRGTFDVFGYTGEYEVWFTFFEFKSPFGIKFTTKKQTGEDRTVEYAVLYSDC